MKVRLTCLAAGLLVLLVASVVVRSSDAGGSQGGATSQSSIEESLANAALAHPNFSIAQRAAIWQAYRASVHPSWRNLSFTQRMARIARAAGGLLFARQEQQQLPAATAAPFQGNLTTVTVSPLDGFVLQRQSNCSLSLITATYALFPPGDQILGTQSSYEQLLHSEAGLTTRADVFPNGCKDPTLGVGARSGWYLGKTSQSLLMFAAWGYDPTQDVNVLLSGSVNAGTLAESSFNEDSSMTNIDDLAVGDLNGDGLADIVGISDYTSSSGNSITVWLANASGTLSSGTSYAVPGVATNSAFVADVNGDGKNDVVVATENTNSLGAETISVLAGNGDGTLNAAQTVGTASKVFQTMIGADVRGNGRVDIVTGSGLVFLSNGDGTFASPITGFTLPPTAVSEASVRLTSGDFNNDGKLDIAVDDGTAITVYLGNGDGTFTPGPSYATTSQGFGYLNAADLDGDGNIDLYSALANGGMFFGDDFSANQGYAVMGRGDGTFAGAPFEGFQYNGSNVADLNGDGHLDAVGVSAGNAGTYTFTSYLGDGKGGFSAAATLAASPVTVGGTQYTFSYLDSYAIADVNGDGIPDLIYIGAADNTVGIAIALGKGDGSFSAPTFIPAPSFVPTGDFDYNEQISNIRLADFNHDGKQDLIYSYADESFNGGVHYLGIAVQLGNGDGTFQAPQSTVYYQSTTAPQDTSEVVAQIADLNGDGKPDLLILAEAAGSNNTITYNAQVRLGNGDGTFGAASTVTVADNLVGPTTGGILQLVGSVPPLVLADMNGDGKLDIVSLGSSSSTDSPEIAISLGNGDGTFSAPVTTQYATGQGAPLAAGLAVGDFNADGKLDVAVTGPLGAGDSGVFLGNGDGTLQVGSINGSAAPLQSVYLQDWGPAVALHVSGSAGADLLAGPVLLINRYASGSGGSPDFTLSANPASLTITAGQSGTSTLTLTPSGGFDETVTFSCSGLPAGASCSFSPAMVTPSGSAVTTTLTINTTAQSAALWVTGSGSALAAFGLILILRRRRDSAPSRAWMANGAALVLAGLACGTLLMACGGTSGGSGSSSASSSSSSSSTTSTVTVTASASSPTAVSHTATITLTVK